MCDIRVSAAPATQALGLIRLSYCRPIVCPNGIPIGSQVSLRAFFMLSLEGFEPTHVEAWGNVWQFSILFTAWRHSPRWLASSLCEKWKRVLKARKRCAASCGSQGLCSTGVS